MRHMIRGVVGGGMRFVSDREVCGRNQSEIDCVREGRDVGIIRRERRGVGGDINRTQGNKHNTAMHSTQGRGRKRRSRLPFLDVLREPLKAFEQALTRRSTAVGARNTRQKLGQMPDNMIRRTWGEHTMTCLASDAGPIFQSLQRVTWLRNAY